RKSADAMAVDVADVVDLCCERHLMMAAKPDQRQLEGLRHEGSRTITADPPVPKACTSPTSNSFPRHSSNAHTLVSIDPAQCKVMDVFPGLQIVQGSTGLSSAYSDPKCGYQSVARLIRRLFAESPAARCLSVDM